MNDYLDINRYFDFARQDEGQVDFESTKKVFQEV